MVLIKNLNNIKLFILNILLIFLFSVLARLYFYANFSDKILTTGDVFEYSTGVEMISKGYGLVEYDQVFDKLVNYSRRPPFFFYSSYFIKKIFKTNSITAIIILNFAAHTLIILLSTYLTYIINLDTNLSIINGWLMTLNINLFYNSLLIMSDTYFTLLIISFTIIALKSINNPKFYFLSGVILALATLTRPTSKFLWIFFIIYLLFFYKEKKQFIKNSLIFLIGYILLIIPYHIYVYKKYNLKSLDSFQGTYATWKMNKLFNTTDYTSLINKDASYSVILNILKKHEHPIGPVEIEVRKKLNLTVEEFSEKLTKLAIYTILHNPIGYSKLFLENIINNISSASSYLSIIDLFKPGYYDKQHKIMIDIIENKKFKSKSIKYILLNIIFRIINILFFILSLIGMYISLNKINKKITTFLLLILSYIIIFSSLSSSYDRYRLPVEFIISFYLTYFIYNFKELSQKFSKSIKIPFKIFG